MKKNYGSKIADLYIRVSTDEQADKGYSQRDQAERLKGYCAKYGIAVQNVIFEDHSAKNFERPEWTAYLKNLKKRSKKDREPRLILFTKWDRFSRNAGDAYHMISVLESLQVEPQAIEQPLDLKIPENKIVLAIYLSTPEVENDRRALNVFYGMRRARKEGRIMGTPPYGYINRCTEDGRKYIGVLHPEADNIIWAFEEIAKGELPSEHIRVLMNKRQGKNLTRNAFMVAIRNPVYTGKVFIAEFENEPAHYVKGKHLPLISEELFEKVQRVLEGKSRKSRTEVGESKVLSNESFPLRGILICPRCGNTLTASTSKGNTKFYSYYHCNSKCGFRHNSDDLNKKFVDDLRKYEILPEYKDLLKVALLRNYKKYCGNVDDERKSVMAEIEKVNQKLTKARDLFLTDRLDEDDYTEVKKECKQKLEELEENLKGLVKAGKDQDIPGKLSLALDGISNLAQRYVEGSLDDRRKIASSIYYQKLEFDGKTFRTPKSNAFLNLIKLSKSGLEGQKKSHQNLENPDDHRVSAKGFEPLTVPIFDRDALSLLRYCY
ncbi:recombinase family protein [Chryseobacterium sp. UNC8MFCol]|uniref:recombinase family protein n=1 Tax=Chryseobacterium sp. UNC8MFCol TaxID=1340435 RepID=UPI00068EA3F0|nr:recombinase family protein [Chryseobacterium sp. UNC8MFCol]